MKLRSLTKRLVSTLLTAVVLATGVGSVAEASSLPYSSYNYTYWEDIVFTPAAYVPRSSVSGTDLTYNG